VWCCNENKYTKRNNVQIATTFFKIATGSPNSGWTYLFIILLQKIQLKERRSNNKECFKMSVDAGDSGETSNYSFAHVIPFKRNKDHPGTTKFTKISSDILILVKHIIMVFSFK
jgi:hypothetical protein